MEKLIGTSVMLVGRSLLIKFIGLLSTLALARLLMPEDFGIVALSLLVIGFLKVFARSGSYQYVLRGRTISIDLIDSAWTLNIVMKSSVAVVVILAAGGISEWYKTPELHSVLQVMAILIVLESMNNPGIWEAAYEQRYDRVVILDLASKVCSAIVGVSLAFLGAGYWALIAGSSAMTVSKLIGSYLLYEYRPSANFHGFKEQMSFSGWLLAQGFFGYTRNNIDSLMVSSGFGGASLGFFHTMKYLAYIPSEQIIAPASQPLLRALSESRENPAYFALQNNVAFLLTASLSLPIAAIASANAENIVYLLLGKKWVSHSNLFYWFCWLIPAYFLFHYAMRLCVVFAKTRQVFFYEAFAAFLIFLPLYILGLDDLTLFTRVRVSLELDSFSSLRIVFYYYVHVTKELASPIAPCYPFSLLHSAGALAVKTYPTFDVAFIDTAVKSTALMLIYVCFLPILWFGPWKTGKEYTYLREKSELLTRKLLDRLVHRTPK